MEDQRPPRAELFAFYYLGITPAGTYLFPNINQLARHYNASVECVLNWLMQYGLDSATVGKKSIELSRHSMDLQFELGNMTPEVLQKKIQAILAEFDEARTCRKPWVDGPIR